jgi:hypothetical protein
MSKLSAQVQQLEDALHSIEYENQQLKAMLYRLITGDKDSIINPENIEFIAFDAEFEEAGFCENGKVKYRMKSISYTDDSFKTTTKEIS